VIGPLRRRLHAAIDRRVALRDPEIDRRIAQRRAEALQEHQVFGPEERLRIDPTAKVNDALFNTVSGTITVGAHAFFGHRVMVLTGSHDVDRTGAERQAAIPREGRDVAIEAGAWVASGAIVLGPCRVGRDAVVAAGAVVTGDVAPGARVGGNPARPLE
jgi:acetyltransferase-like isoleucine patch superfamily enzyme